MLSLLLNNHLGLWTSDLVQAFSSRYDNHRGHQNDAGTFRNPGNARPPSTDIGESLILIFVIAEYLDPDGW